MWIEKGGRREKVLKDREGREKKEKKGVCVSMVRVCCLGLPSG